MGAAVAFILGVIAFIINEPGPKAPELTWEGFCTPPKFGSELPGPKGRGFKKQDENSKTQSN
jgi:hypothetical protein